MKTATSAVQGIIDQRLYKQYGGEPRNFENLPSTVADTFSGQYSHVLYKLILRRRSRMPTA